MLVNPYTAFVDWPVVVEKFSTGRAKNARYASECPSNSRSRVPAPGTSVAGGLVAVADGPVLVTLTRPSFGSTPDSAAPLSDGSAPGSHPSLQSHEELPGGLP